MKVFLAGLMIGLLALPLTSLCYVNSGRAPLAALDQPMRFEAFLACADQLTRDELQALKPRTTSPEAAS